ncbi:MAG TPA: alpha/beta hydrolase, partial [Anaerolineae bacterium]|nr:alpha/beta hydrolase [Anaerolineae bacterium]
MSALIIDGNVVHYEAFGRGKPVLFIHGWLGSWRYWVPTMEAISDKYRTYALDLWGFGDSAKSKPRYNVPDYVALINNFVTAMGIRQAPLVGHALGATVALEYAACYPDQVKKIVAISLPLTPDSISHKLLNLASDSMIAKLFWRRQISYKEVQQESEKTGPGAISLSVQSVTQMDVERRLQSLGSLKGLLVLTVYGEKDDLIDPGPARNLNGHWPNIRPIGLADSKHFPMLDETAKFNRLLKDFLETEDDLSALELKEEWRRRTR